jgi:hypothetical protein
VVALDDITSRLSAGAKGRTEADIQSDVRALLLLARSLELIEEDIEVFLEAPAGGGRRIDVEAGSTVFEVKKSVRPGRALDAAVDQLATYVRHRTEELARRHVGVLTDGQTWILYHLRPGGDFVEVNRIRMRDRRDGERLVAWLETILATRKEVAPTPREIVQRLGADSPAAQLDLADLRALYAACRGNPEVQVKRELWARLLLSALGAGFEDSDELFVTHTYLVLTAELIAHEVMGLPTDPASTDVRALLEGQQFAMSGLHGVVEADFFDWPATITQGQPVITAIARRLSLFAWRNVEHDVLKALYESVIDADTRRRLGEYYTPDWLAEKMVAEHFQDPMNQRVLDPACGSGTFLFWAVRRALQSCDAAGMDNQAAVAHVVSRIQGMDLHPVAVTLARVTYLLALTPDRLADRDELTVPVFLGDSVRWEQEDTLRSEDGITVRTTDPLEMIEDESKLHFPEGVIEEPQRFDRLVAELANKAAKRKPKTKPPSIKGLLNRHKVTGDEDRRAVEIAFKKLCRLHDSGRDHVWSYYIRNLMRPLSFMRPEGQVDLLIGNPPWLSYRSMPRKLQRTYQSLAKQRGLWAGGKVATNQDLSDLFAARSVEQYLKVGGSFAFVMPHGVLSRRQYRGFRSGDWQPGECGARVQFRVPEDLAKVKPPPFANASCVVSGTKTRSARALPASAIEWTGRLSSRQLSWGDASRDLASAGRAVIAVSDTHESPYRALFQQGASLVPRMLVTVEEVEGGPIGVTSGRVRVRSARSANEKPPWKSLPALEGVVERRFVRPMHVGATILAYRARDPQLAIVPQIDEGLIDNSDERLDEFPGLAGYWREAEEVWESNRGAATRLGLLEQVDFRSKLSKQFPIAEHRVVYTKSGQHLAACRITDNDAVIDHKLYWAAVSGVEEARYLCAVLNSQVLADAVVGLQARGQHNPRDFDMHIFALGFPIFDPTNGSHRQLAQLATRAEKVASDLDVDPAWQFQKARRIMREALREDGVATLIDAAVVELLGTGSDASVEANLQVEPASTTDLMDAFSGAERAAKGRGTKKGRRAAGARTKQTASQPLRSRIDK